VIGALVEILKKYVLRKRDTERLGRIAFRISKARIEPRYEKIYSIYNGLTRATNYNLFN